MKFKSLKSLTDYVSIFALCISVFAVFFSIWTFTGKWPWLGQPYNSYILQAETWKNGSLALPGDIPYLELAIFEGRYFVSFPPFPSFLMFPFVLLGFTNCDGLIALVSALAGAVYAYKICEHFDVKKERAFLFALLLTIGSNWLFTALTAWVWFIAQNLAFTLSLIAIYYALKKKPGLSLAFWACAVGCRPFQILYLPVLLYLIYDKNMSLAENIKSKWKSVIPMAVIAISYMVLNFARFGNPFEFGHNYLPEFTRTQTGQFSLTYMSTNIRNLFRFPKISFSGKWEFQAADGTNMFIISPIFISYIAYTIYAFVKKKADKKLIIAVLVTVIVHLLFITAHKTMGGAHFGNRYTNDVLPLLFVGLLTALPKKNKYENINIILLLFGLVTNVIGSTLYFSM